MTENLHVSHSDKTRPTIRAAMLPALAQEALEEQHPLLVYFTSKTQEGFRLPHQQNVPLLVLLHIKQRVLSTRQVMA